MGYTRIKKYIKTDKVRMRQNPFGVDFVPWDNYKRNFKDCNVKPQNKVPEMVPLSRRFSWADIQYGHAQQVPQWWHCIHYVTRSLFNLCQKYNSHCQHQWRLSEYVSTSCLVKFLQFSLQREYGTACRKTRFRKRV